MFGNRDQKKQEKQVKKKAVIELQTTKGNNQKLKVFLENYEKAIEDIIEIKDDENLKPIIQWCINEKEEVMTQIKKIKDITTSEKINISLVELLGFLKVYEDFFNPREHDEDKVKDEDSESIAQLIMTLILNGTYSKDTDDGRDKLEKLKKLQDECINGLNFLNIIIKKIKEKIMKQQNDIKSLRQSVTEVQSTNFTIVIKNEDINEAEEGAKKAAEAFAEAAAEAVAEAATEADAEAAGAAEAATDADAEAKAKAKAKAVAEEKANIAKVAKKDIEIENIIYNFTEVLKSKELEPDLKVDLILKLREYLKPIESTQISELSKMENEILFQVIISNKDYFDSLKETTKKNELIAKADDTEQSGGKRRRTTRKRMSKTNKCTPKKRRSRKVSRRKTRRKTKNNECEE